MSETRKMYHFMLEGQETDLRHRDLEHAIWELATGQKSFGAREEWTEWLHYLLWLVAEKAQTEDVADLYEHCLTGFLTRYPFGASDGLDRKLADDVLLSFGRAPMTPRWWDRDFNLGLPSLSKGDPSHGAFWLMIKYLDERDLPAWWLSVVAIDHPVWRINLILWLDGVSPLFLERNAQPDQLRNVPSASWEPSYVLDGKHADANGATVPFLDKEQRHAMLELFRETLTQETLLAWVEDFEPLLEKVKGDWRGTHDLLGSAADCATKYGLKN